MEILCYEIRKIMLFFRFSCEKKTSKKQYLYKTTIICQYNFIYFLNIL